MISPSNDSLLGSTNPSDIGAAAAARTVSATIAALIPPPVQNLDHPFAYVTPHDGVVFEIIEPRPLSTSAEDYSVIVDSSPANENSSLPDIYVVAPAEEERGIPECSFRIFSADEPRSPVTPDLSRLHDALADLERMTAGTPTFRRPRMWGSGNEKVILPMKKLSKAPSTWDELRFEATMQGAARFARGAGCSPEQAKMVQAKRSSVKGAKSALKGALKSARNLSQLSLTLDIGKSRAGTMPGTGGGTNIHRPASPLDHDSDSWDDDGSFVEIPYSPSSPPMEIDGWYRPQELHKKSRDFSKLFSKGGGRPPFTSQASRQSTPFLPLTETTNGKSEFKLYKQPARALSSFSLGKKSKSKPTRSTDDDDSHFRPSLSREDIPPLPPIICAVDLTRAASSSSSSTSPSSTSSSTPPLMPSPLEPSSPELLLQYVAISPPLPRSTELPQTPPSAHSHTPRIRYKTQTPSSRPFSSFFDLRRSGSARPPPIPSARYSSPPACQTSPRSFLARFSLHSPPLGSTDPRNNFPTYMAPIATTRKGGTAFPRMKAWGRDVTTGKRSAGNVMATLDSLHFSELSIDLSSI